MKRKENLWENELWTQSEVAEEFRTVSGTVKNWRERGLLRYWQPPGSSNVLFYREDIRAFRDEHFSDERNVSKKGGNKLKTAEIKKVKPSVSSVKKKWRI